MAGDLKRFVFEERENTRRYNANIDAIIEKYGKPSKYVDIVDLDNLEITTSKGMLRRQVPRHFGHTRLQHTKRQEESMLIPEDNSLLSCSLISTADSESTEYGSKQLNSSGGSFVPRTDVRPDTGGWLDRSRHSHRNLNTFSLSEQESKCPNQGLDTFSLAEQVDDAEDAGELLSLQETMLTFIKEDIGEPSDAETLSSSCTSSETSKQHDADVMDSEGVIQIESDESEIDSDKSDVGDNTICQREKEKDKNKWSPQNRRGMGDAWWDRKEDQFTLISSSQDSDVSNLHDGVRSSDGVEWSVNRSPCPLTNTYRWKGNDEYHHESPTHIGTGRPALTERQSIVSLLPTVDKHENRKNSPKSVFKVMRSPAKCSMVNRISAQRDEVDGDSFGAEVLHGVLHKNQQQKDDLHKPKESSKMPWNIEGRFSKHIMSDDVLGNQDYSTNHKEFSGRPESKLRTEVLETDQQLKSRPLVKNSQSQRSWTPLPSTTNRTKSFKELVSKSVPSKLMVQNLKDLPRGELSASTISKDPLTSMEKVYRWLSPPTTTFTDQRHKVNARRRLQLATSSSDNIVLDNKVYDNKLGVGLIPEERKVNTDCFEPMDSTFAEMDMDSHHKQVEPKGRLNIEQQPMMRQKELHKHSLTQRLTTACNSGENFRSPEKQHRSSNMWEDTYVPERQPVTPITDRKEWKSPSSARQGFQMRSPWESPNMTPKRNKNALLSSDVTSSPRDSMSPNSNSPWRSRSCGQRFHPYSRRNPDSPSAIFARLKLSISSPSSNREDTAQQNHVEKTSSTTKVKKSANVPSPRQPTKNHNIKNEMVSPTKSWQQLKQVAKCPMSDRSSEEVFPAIPNQYHRDSSGTFQPKSPSVEQGRNTSQEKPSRKHETLMSSNRGQYSKRSTDCEGKTRSFDIFDKMDLQSSSKRKPVLKGHHLSKPCAGSLQNDELSTSHKYIAHKPTCQQNNSRSPERLYSTYHISKSQQERKEHTGRDWNYRSQNPTRDIAVTSSPFSNAKTSTGQDFIRKESCHPAPKQHKSVPKTGAVEVEKSQRFVSPTRWKRETQENGGSNLFFSMQDSGGECTFKSNRDCLEKHGIIISNSYRSNVPDKPLQSTCESPLVKISSKPKAVTPGRTASLQTGSKLLESRSHEKGSTMMDRAETFKQPMGTFVSLRDKVLANNQRHSSTPLKHTPQFILNDTLSTIHPSASDTNSDSSEEMVLTISPTY
ncbi:uncharacterized protein LOC110454117 isoform X2 [Mizuhopecten yessoensis]|uniref:uncharacterized protein LOC110454117 isoform X2 n=1 Tax=Mizuhopecten yessoensis TaxID=6573 RepID=UPI000B45873C|nr:uncharacterized protein LOC110454117 isoform X2 [Mizuhopecten yessoensis]